MQEHNLQWQETMEIRSGTEEQCKGTCQSGRADRANLQHFLSGEGYDLYDNYDLKTQYNELMDFIDKPLAASSRSTLEAALKLANEKKFIKSLRLAFLAGQQDAITQWSQASIDEQTLERCKWCVNRNGVNSLPIEEDYKVVDRLRVPVRKRRLCRHFLKGHCKRGSSCDFLHDASIFCVDQQKVFLGGLPAHITQTRLRLRMAEQGFEIINSPKVLRGFTPQVCLASVEQAQLLIEKGRISIDGTDVDVRPYRPYNVVSQWKKPPPDEVSRSVFLGGLKCGTTRHMIKDDLEKLGMEVVNHPRVKMGFSPQVTLGTAEQARKLVQLKQVMVNNALVDVRPYIDARRVVSENEKK